MNLSDYRTELRDRISDDQTIIQTHFSDSQLNSYINRSRRIINQMLLVYENQDYIIPKLWIDEYDLPKDFIAMNRVYCPFEEVYYNPVVKPKAETLNTDYDYILEYENLFYINEKRKRITFLKPPELVPVDFIISAFDRAAGTVTIDGCQGAGTITTSGTSATLSGETTAHLKAGYKITVGAEEIAIDSITGTYTLTLESAPASDWSADTYTFVTEDDCIPNIGSWEDIKPHIRLRSTADSLVFNFSSQSTTITLDSVTDDFDNLEVGMEVSGAGIQSGTTIIAFPTATTITLSKRTVATGTDVTVTFTTYEYCTVSKIVANSTKTVYTLYISSFNLKDLDYEYAFADGDYLTMVSYVHEYISNTKDLSNDYTEDGLPTEAQELVTIYAEALCFQNNNLMDRKLLAINEFNERLSDVRYAINADKIHIANQMRKKYGG